MHTLERAHTHAKSNSKRPTNIKWNIKYEKENSLNVFAHKRAHFHCFRFHFLTLNCGRTISMIVASIRRTLVALRSSFFLPLLLSLNLNLSNLFFVLIAPLSFQQLRTRSNLTTFQRVPARTMVAGATKRTGKTIFVGLRAQNSPLHSELFIIRNSLWALCGCYQSVTPTGSAC